MNIPNLINIYKDKEVDDSVFIDLEINRILSYSDISFLKWPCNEKEIGNRQGIFRSMKKEFFYSTFTKCYNAINNYETDKKAVQTSHHELEKYYRILHILEDYVIICESFKQLYGYCDALNEVAEYFISEEKVDERNRIKANISEMKEIFLTVSRFTVSFVDEDQVQKGHISSSYINKINQCAKALQLDASCKSSTNIPFDDILSDALKRLYSNEFIRLNAIEVSCNKELTCDFSDTKNQMSFILNIWALVQKAASVGIPYTFPLISKVKEIRINNAYGITLLSKNAECFVPNNISFDESVPFYFLVGANGGGKTEYLRTLGTNLLLFLSGCPIFAESALIYPFSYLSSHFPKDERYESVGRLDDENKRVKSMIEKADYESVLLFNETFSGTDQEQGLALLLKVAEYLRDNKIFGLAVTHFQGIDARKYAVLCPEVICTPNNGNKRTYRIVKKTNTTSSYTNDIIRKYKLDQESLRIRKALING